MQHIKHAEGISLSADDLHGIADHIVHIDGGILFYDIIEVCAQTVDVFGKRLLERLKLPAGFELFKMGGLFLLTDGDDAQIRDWFGKLSDEGRYEVTGEVLEKLQRDFVGGFCDDADTKKTIHDFKAQYGYTCDTHTAVAVKVYLDYIAKTGDTTRTLIASTASPYKFSASVLEAIEGSVSAGDEYAQVDRLAALSGLPVPASLAALKDKPVRFSEVIAKENMESFVLGQMGIES